MSYPENGAPPGGIDYVAEENSPRFKELKRKHRSFVFPLAVIFIVWYAVYVLLSTFASDFMATPVSGNITIGLLFGLGQFVSTFVITMLYVWYANNKLDPISSEIRENLEAKEPVAG